MLSYHNVNRRTLLCGGTTRFSFDIVVGLTISRNHKQKEIMKSFEVYFNHLHSEFPANIYCSFGSM